MFLLGASTQSLDAQTIAVTEVQRTRGLSANPFGTIGGMLEASAGVVVISDDVNKTVWRWDLAARRVSRFARDGRGPSEVITPISFARRPGGGFALYDPGHASVLSFDLALTFESAARLQGGIVSNPKSMAVLTDGSFVISGGRLRDPRHLHRYTAAGEWIESFGDPSPRVTSDNGLQSPTRIAEDLQLLPELTEENLHGPPRTVAPAIGLRPFLWWHDRSTGVFVLPDGRLLNVVTRYDRGDSVWDVYSSDGRRVVRTVIPRAWYAWDLTFSGDILASYRDPDTDEHIAAVLKIEVR